MVCRCCCSLQSLAVVAALLALLRAMNPFLDRLVPLDPTELARLNAANAARPPFDPSTTNVVGYSGMQFVKDGRQTELRMGLTYMMYQSFPRWAVKLAGWLDPTEAAGEDATEARSIDILDARRAEAVAQSTFEERGFTLLDMGGAPSLGKEDGVRNWRSQEEIKMFQRDLEPRLLGLFPGATRIEYTYSVVRNGDTFGDQPAAIDAPHLDYTQNDAARREFHDVHPVFFGAKEPRLLLGEEDTDAEEVRALVGIWKPVAMRTPVCDHPLAVMDARTFREEREGLYPIHINFGFATLHNLNGAIHHDVGQRWYYYPFQEESEVLVFTQYTRGRHHCTPHGSFVNPNCPEDSDRRVSVEMRAAVFFKK